MPDFTSYEQRIQQLLDPLRNLEGDYGAILDQFGVDTQAQRQALIERLRQEEAALYQQYKDQLLGQESYPELYQRLSEQYNLPGLQEQLQGMREEVFSTKDLLDRLEEDVTSRTTGSLVTEAQRRRQIAAEGDPLRTALGRLMTGQELAGQQYGEASDLVKNLMGLYQSQQGKELQPILMQIDSLSDWQARELTGFSEDKELQYNLLLQKLSSGRELAQQEYSALMQLEGEKREYDIAKEKAAVSGAANQGVLDQWLKMFGGGDQGMGTNEMGSQPDYEKMLSDILAQGGGSDTEGFQGDLGSDYLNNQYGNLNINPQDVSFGNDVSSYYTPFQDQYKNLTQPGQSGLSGLGNLGNNFNLIF